MFGGSRGLRPHRRSAARPRQFYNRRPLYASAARAFISPTAFNSSASEQARGQALRGGPLWEREALGRRNWGGWRPGRVRSLGAASSERGVSSAPGLERLLSRPRIRSSRGRATVVRGCVGGFGSWLGRWDL